jgi:capsular polysaccharide biosynthesis protein
VLLVTSLLKRAVGQLRREFSSFPDWATTLKDESVRWKAGQPDWESILTREAGRWKSVRKAAEKGPEVLIATSSGGFPVVSAVETTLGVALTLRGAGVHFLACDKFLPACVMSVIGFYPRVEQFAKHGPKHMCQFCYPLGQKMFRILGLPVHRFSKYVLPEEASSAEDISSQLPIAEIPSYQLDGVAVGEHCYAGALRFYQMGDLTNAPEMEPIVRRYLRAAMLTAYASQRLLSARPFVSTCLIHGIYVPHGVISEVARRKSIRNASWSHSYRKHTFVFSHNDTYHHTMLSEPTETWENMAWTSEMEAEIVDYLQSRWTGKRDWISYCEDHRGDIDVEAKLGIDFSKPCVGMLTNIMFDAQVLYRSNAFPNMVDWVLETIRYFSKRPDLQLIIRVHPAELQRGKRSLQPLINIIKENLPELPPNVFLIPPDSPISTYAVMMKCDSVIIWATKTGVELTSMGIPVIVAGEAWIRNKGITMDASTGEEYFKILERLPLGKRLSEHATRRARKYAYHFFFRRMIPLGVLQPAKTTFYELNIKGLEDLMPGRSVGLDVICNGIMNGDEFIYPAESVREDFDER